MTTTDTELVCPNKKKISEFHLHYDALLDLLRSPDCTSCKRICRKRKSKCTSNCNRLHHRHCHKDFESRQETDFRVEGKGREDDPIPSHIISIPYHRPKWRGGSVGCGSASCTHGQDVSSRQRSWRGSSPWQQSGGQDSPELCSATIRRNILPSHTGTRATTCPPPSTMRSHSSPRRSLSSSAVLLTSTSSWPLPWPSLLSLLTPLPVSLPPLSLWWVSACARRLSRIGVASYRLVGSHLLTLDFPPRHVAPPPLGRTYPIFDVPEMC